MPTEEQLRGILRFDLAYFSIAVLVLTVAVLSLASAVFRKLQDRFQLLFGFLGILYGSRLLFQNSAFTFAIRLSPYHARQGFSILCYLIPVAGIYLWTFLLSRRSRTVLLLAVAAHALFAAYGIPHDLIAHQPWAFPRINAILVIASSLMTATLLVLDVRSGFIPINLPLRAAGFGFVIFELGVIYDNLASLHWVPDFWTEPFTFTAFLISMGVAVQYRVNADRNRLTLLAAEMEQARKIQLSILPTSAPATKHFQLAANYSPMTSVAGDLYDFIPLGEERIGLFIADVAGHGLPAALVASMLKTALNIHAREAAGPAELLAELNELFCGQSHGQFITAAYAVLDGNAQTLTYAGAGHPPLLVWEQGRQELKVIERNGLPLGMFRAAAYESQTVNFTRGDRLAMYTDGIVESENMHAEEYGAGRLSEVLKSANGNARELLGKAMSSVQTWRGAQREQADDLTLLIAEHV